MSLIRVRRERKEGMTGHLARPPRLWKQILGLILVLLVMYYLGRAF